MLESLLNSGEGAEVDYPWLLPDTPQTVFRIHSFNTLSDVRDRSVSNVPITKGAGLVVGENSHGPYINFNGSASNYLRVKDAKLDKLQVEINFVISDMMYNGSQYGSAVMDTRPDGSNASNIIDGYTTNSTPPFRSSAWINGTALTGTYLYPQTTGAAPMHIQLQITTTGVRKYVDGVLDYTTAAKLSNGFVDQYINISRSPFASLGVPNCIFKLFYMDIKVIP